VSTFAIDLRYRCEMKVDLLVRSSVAH
jgi:hypothetical protein